MKTSAAVAGAFVAMTAIAGVTGRELASVGVHQGYCPQQPIAFSHRIHAGDNQVPCLYCHSAARRSRHAGIPAAAVCMNCHGLLAKETPEIRKLKETIEQRRPIVWTKVHNLPDFVYFNHSQHVLGAVACQECHGPVETMTQVRQFAPMTMGFCLDCHRARHVGSVRPETRGARFTTVREPAEGLDCGKCHY